MKKLKIHKKKALFSIAILLSRKRFRRFLTGDLCGLPLEAGHFSDMWFATT